METNGAQGETQQTAVTGESFFIARSSKCEPGNLRLMREEGYSPNYGTPISRDEAVAAAKRLAQTDPHGREYFVVGVVYAAKRQPIPVDERTFEQPVIAE